MEFTGTGASEGAVSGITLVFRHEQESDYSGLQDPSVGGKNGKQQELTFESAMEKFFEGRSRVHQELLAMSKEAEEKYGADKAGIFEGYAEILMDEEIEELVASLIKKGYTPQVAARKAMEQQATELEALEGDYMRERASDFADIGRRLHAAVSGEEQSPIPVLTEPCILVADELSPFETVRLDHSLILGLAMDKGGYTGHVAILARSLDIPCVVALGHASTKIKSGSMCVLDGTSGRLITDPSNETLSAFSQKEEERRQHLAVLAKTANEPAITLDGVPLQVCANIGSPEEARRAAIQGADGVGLFRTEFLYIDSIRLPSEEEQFEAYRQVLDALGNKPLTIRTVDIGGDKDHPALGLEKEDNPFLGYRAIRLGLDQPRIFKPQLRAILRASAFGKVELMFPLIISLDEVRQARLLVEECLAELSAEGLEANKPSFGIMVETPAAALLAKEFAAEVDFFSIGTNDLTQYTLAVDRGNTRIASLYDPLNPAVLRLLALTCDAALNAGIPVCICGESAADPKALPLLVGLGITKFSVLASRISSVKANIRALDAGKARELTQKALKLATAAEIHSLL